MMGDKMLERLAIVVLKNHFRRPFEYESPIETSFYISRTIADLWDMHYSLFAQNQHPLQLSIYEEHNKFVRGLHDEKEIEQFGRLRDRVDELKAERESNLASNEGETLTIDDIGDIYMQVMQEYRSERQMNIRSKDARGNINDYLENRRPFGAGQ